MRKNVFMHTPGLGVVWDSKHDVVSGTIMQSYPLKLPTKTSLACDWFTCAFLNARFQVSFITFVNFLFCMNFDMVTFKLLMNGKSFIDHTVPSCTDFSFGEYFLCVFLSTLCHYVAYQSCFIASC